MEEDGKHEISKIMLNHMYNVKIVEEQLRAPNNMNYVFLHN